MYTASIIFVLLGIFTSQVDSSCFQGELVSQVTKYGTLEQLCVYNGMKILPGSSFKTSAPDCFECKCTTQGLKCCGFGFAAGVVVPPERCITHNDACNLILVKKDNPAEMCHQPKTINNAKKNRKILASRRT